MISKVFAVFRWLVFCFFIYFMISLLFSSIYILGRYDYFVIPDTGSMEPTLTDGDLVVIDRSVSLESYEIGDIFVFKAEIESTEIAIIHYLYDIEIDRSGNRIFTAIAGVSDHPDDYVITEDDVIGLYKFKISYLGMIMRFIDHPIGKAVVIIDVVILYVLYRMFIVPKKTSIEEEKS